MNLIWYDIKINDHIQYMPNEDDTNANLVINSKENIEKKYYNILINNLLKKNILNSNDIDNIKLKLSSKLFTLEDVISSLEKMINENELVEKLNDLNFTEIFSENLNTDEKIYLFSHTKIIIGSIGGGMSNLLFSNKETKSIVLVTPYFLDI